MGRPRAGYGSTSIRRGEKLVKYLAKSDGVWIPTGGAVGWPRCSRCRTPIDSSPFNSGFCSICYFYKMGMPIQLFQKLHKEGYPLAPYNIGSKVREGMNYLR